MADPNIVTLTDKNFEPEVLKSPVPVLVDFWAEWCAPCKMIAPMLDLLAAEFAGKVKVAKADVGIEQNQPLAAQYRVSSIPTLLFFKDGQVVDQVVGANKSYKDLKAKFASLSA
jgi:thioredoxin 1